jgi:Xaa-Pro aminopeptidase
MNERFLKLRNLIRDSKISAILIFANPFRQGSLFYAVEDHYVNFGFSVVCISRENAIQLVQGSTQYFYAKEHSFVKDVRIAPDYKKVKELIIDFLTSARIEKGNKSILGVANLDILPAQFYFELAKEFELEDVSDQMQGFLFRKDQISLGQSRASAAVADDVLAYIMKKIRIGATGDAILGAMQELMMQKHCSDSFNMVSVGKRPKVMFKLCPDRISKGDILTTEITPRLGMWTQLNRPIAIGDPSREAKESVEACISVVSSASREIRPGTKTGDIATFMVEKIQSFGYDPISPADMGHMIGFEITENWVRPDSTLSFDTGMTFVLHAIVNDRNSGFMIFGDTYLMKRDGPERLTKTPQKFFVRKKI